MTLAQIPHLYPALSEIIITLGILSLLVIGALRPNIDSGFLSKVAVGLLFLAAGFLGKANGLGTTFEGQFVQDIFSITMKAFILLFTGLALWANIPHLRQSHLHHFEYPIVLSLACLGLMIMCSATHFLMLFMGIELAALSGYILVAFQRDSALASEAALKYFVLGATASAISLYGFSLVYAATGTLAFEGVHTVLQQGAPLPLLFMIGMTMVFAGLVFKIAAAPFHMWAPDVYAAAPLPVAAFLVAAPKIAATAVLLRLMYQVLPSQFLNFSVILQILSVASLVMGAISALRQQNIRRLFAFSAVHNAGFLLLGIAAGGQDAITGSIIYVLLYGFTVMTLFLLLTFFENCGEIVESLSDLPRLWAQYRPACMLFAVMIFSLAGLPPFPGFIAKILVLKAAVGEHLYTTAIIAVLTSTIAAAYYLGLIRYLYVPQKIDSNAARPDGTIIVTFDATQKAMLALLYGCVGLLLSVLIFPGFLIRWAEAAASALIQ